MNQITLTSFRIEARAMIFLAGEPAAHWGKVTSGVIAECENSSDGERRLTGFRLPGEAFGVELGQYTRSSEALVESVIECYPTHGPLAEAPFSAAISEQLQRVRGDQRVTMLRSVPQRFAALVIDLADRGLGYKFRFPMPRCDIADFLGTTEPTISRTLAWLEERNAVKRDRHGIINIIDRDLLSQYARSSDRIF